MPIRYKGEDDFVIARARRSINLIPSDTINPGTKTQMQAFADNLVELALLANENGNVRYALKDILTIAAVLIEDPNDAHKQEHSQGSSWG